jgi:Helix-turn-helix domain
MPKVPPLVTSAEAATIIGRDVRTIHRLVERGDLQPATKLPGIRGAFLFRREDVERLAGKTQAGAA